MGFREEDGSLCVPEIRIFFQSLYVKSFIRKQRSNILLTQNMYVLLNMSNIKRLFFATIPNNEKKVKSTTCNAEFLANLKCACLEIDVVKNGLKCGNDNILSTKTKARVKIEK